MGIIYCEKDRTFTLQTKEILPLPPAEVKDRQSAAFPVEHLLSGYVRSGVRLFLSCC